MDKLYDYKIINSRGAKHHLIKVNDQHYWKHHRWDGPAIEPTTKDSEFNKSYFLHGIEYDYEEYSELMKEREGLPWYKNPTMRGTSRL